MSGLGVNQDLGAVLPIRYAGEIARITNCNSAAAAGSAFAIKLACRFAPKLPTLVRCLKSVTIHTPRLRGEGRNGLQ